MKMRRDLVWSGIEKQIFDLSFTRELQLTIVESNSLIVYSASVQTELMLSCEIFHVGVGCPEQKHGLQIGCQSLLKGRSFWGLFRNRNTRNRRYSCSFKNEQNNIPYILAVKRIQFAQNKIISVLLERFQVDGNRRNCALWGTSSFSVYSVIPELE